MNARWWCTSVAWVGTLCSCDDSLPPGRSRLERLADSVRSGGVLEECIDAPDSLALDAQGFRECRLRKLDTTIVVMTSLEGQVLRITRAWPQAQEELRQHYDSVSELLSHTLGPGLPVCPSGVTPLGRQWQLPEYHITLVRGLPESHLELTYSRGAPRFSSVCLGNPPELDSSQTEHP